MWQIICLCPPAVTRSEQQRFFTLFRDALHASGKESGGLDLSLFFLHTLSPQESLTVLEERLDLVVRSQELMESQLVSQQPRETSAIQTLIDDHIRTLLAAEQSWLQRTLAQLRTTYVRKVASTTYDIV